MFGYDAATFDQTIEAFNARLHPDDLRRVTEVLAALHRRPAATTTRSTGSSVRTATPAGCTPAAARSPAPTATAVRLLGAAYDTTGEREGAALVTRVLEAMPAGFFSLDRQWRFTHVNAEAERLLGRTRDSLLGRVIWDDWPAASGSVFEDNYRTRRPSGRARVVRRLLPGSRSTAGSRCGRGRAPTGCRSTSPRSPSAGASQEQAERSARRLRPARPGRRRARRHPGRPRPRRRTSPGWSSRRWPTSCVVTVVEPDGRARATSAPGTPTREHRKLLDRYASVRLDAMPAVSPARPRPDHRRGDPAPTRRRCCGVLPPGRVARPARRCSRPERRSSLPHAGPRPHARAAHAVLRSRAERVADEDLATAQDVADRGGPGAGQRAALQRPAAAGRGAAAQPAHRAPAARPRRDRGALPARGGGRPGRRRLVRRVPAARRLDDARDRRRRRARHRRGRGDGPAARPAARHRHLQRRRARRRCCAGWTPR